MSTKEKNKMVFVALSGGVDSSVAATLLKEQGFDLVGCHIKCFNIDGCGERDAEDARRVAEQLGIPFYTFDLEQEYKEKVVKYMVDGYRRGLTPNPDIMCNREIKFGLFLKRALELGADYVATGHYVKIGSYHQSTPQKTESARSSGSPLLDSQRVFARNNKTSEPSKRASETFLRRNSGVTRFYLSVAKDKNKDQSYFLWTLTQDQLKHCLFPLGDYTKSQVRKLAKKYGLLTANKKDSQGICFLGKVALADFLKDYIPAKRGLVLNTAGEKVGQHNGAQFYTIGQRHGLNLGRITANPHYVAEKDIKKNVVTVAEGADNDSLYKKEVKLVDLNYMPKKEVAILTRVRYRQPLQKVVLNKNTLIFAKPQKFIAPGQSAVFYDAKGTLLGGGIIGKY